MKLGESIKRLCKERGWTLAMLARKSNVPAQTLNGWTEGRKAVNLDHLARVADCLEIPLYELVYGTHDPHAADTDVILNELFSGDVRVTIHRIERKRPK